MSPLNPESPPPILRERAVSAVRTAARKNRKGLLIAFCGGCVGGMFLSVGVGVGIAAVVTAAFYLGTVFHWSLASGGE